MLARADQELGLHRPAFLDLAISLGLLVSVFAVYAQVSQFDFVSFDDDEYVYQNEAVQAGLTPASVEWAFAAVVVGNWMPVTLLSHMLDVQLFGLHSGMHHLVNVAIHALSSVLLFVLLLRATQARAASAFVAFVFALHPLHVESVAWIAERKDVLSTFFFLLALYAYIRYTERPSTQRYLPIAGLFCLSLLSKPMMVTFPFVLLLFDIWPLRRVRSPNLVWEKLPLFALSAAASLVTYLVQRSSGAVAEAIPLGGRIAKSLLSYMTYIRQTFWPVQLAVFYPYPLSMPATRVAAALAILLFVSAFVIAAWRRRPYLAMGWFWYLGTLVPVIGLVKIGQQSHADRYTYIPMVGLSIILAWSAAEVVGKWPRTKSAIAAAAAFAGVACLALTWKQASYWRNGETLFQHAIDVTGDNWLAEGNLGQYLMTVPERRGDALDHLQAAVRLRSDYAEAQGNIGQCLRDAGLPLEAIPHFEAALRVKPNNARLHADLAVTLSKTPGRNLQAVDEFETALRLKPDYAQAHYALGKLLASLGRTQEAISHFETAQRLHPDPALAQTVERLRAGQFDEHAIVH